MVVPLVAYGAVAAASALAGALSQKKKKAPFRSGLRDETIYARQDFEQIYGRQPTEAELAQIVPAYVGSDQHITNNAQGKSYIAQMYQAEQNSPAKLYEKQQAEWRKEAPNQYGSVGNTIKSLLGRDASQDELDHFGTMLASGQVDAYQLQDFLKAQPEYQGAQDKKFRGELSSELEGYDRSFFDTAKEDVISRYAQMGRSTSPALDVALTDLQGQINERRGQYLAQLGADQYRGNKDAAFGDYRTTQSDWLSRRNQDIDARYSGMDRMRSRADEISDYTRQNSDFDRYNSMYGGGKQPGSLDYLNTAFQGMNAYSNYKKAA